MQALEDAPRGGFDNGNAVFIQTRDMYLTTDSYGAPVAGSGTKGDLGESRRRNDRA